MMKWWGYRHIQGSVHLKRFYDQADVDEAYESDFVDDVCDPFDAPSRETASNVVSEWAKLLVLAESA